MTVRPAWRFRRKAKIAGEQGIFLVSREGYWMEAFPQPCAPRLSSLEHKRSTPVGGVLFEGIVAEKNANWQEHNSPRIFS